MKKVLSILLIFSIIFPISGTFFWLKLESHQIKKTVKRKLIKGVDKSELTKLSFTNSEVETKLKWKHSKEFEYNGEMYDVVYTENNDGKTTFFCWWDKAETKLNKQIDKLTQIALNGNPEHNSQKSIVLNYIQSLFCGDVQSIIPKTIFNQSKKQFFGYEFNIKQSNLNPISPPPKSC